MADLDAIEALAVPNVHQILTLRELELLKLRAAGWTYAECGRIVRFGYPPYSGQRMRQVALGAYAKLSWMHRARFYELAVLRAIVSELGDPARRGAPALRTGRPRRVRSGR